MLKFLACAAGLFIMFPSFAAMEPTEVLSGYTMPQGYSEVSQNIANALIEDQQGIVVDVRTKEEFDEGHIEGALNIPVETIHPGEEIAALPNKDTPLLLYCRTGRRATVAGQILMANGYKYVVNFGGITTWRYGLIATP